MILSKEVKEKIYQKAALCRAFEEEVFAQVKSGFIKAPVYLSAGQEYISATLSVAMECIGVSNPQIFIQHRGHSTYLNFGGDIKELIEEILGLEGGCAGGMGGSASIQSKSSNIYGHDGLMGSHGPIATGMCYANKLPTLCFTGDAAAEEDYFLTSIGWASTKELPIWYIVEDNNLSILTEKRVRRNWEMSDVGNAFKVQSHNLSDDPEAIFKILPKTFDKPLVLNINTNRLFWHAGAGIDSMDTFDRHRDFSKNFELDWTDYINNEAKKIVKEAWKPYLKS